jgi:AraC-like DNA-binding protein
MFTAAEYYDMLIVYGACGESAYAAVEACAARFPANVFLRLVNRARNTENLVPQTKGVGGVTQEARTPQNDEAVLQAFEEDGTLSIRSVASMFDISKSTTQRILKDNRQHAYHYTRLQNLLPEDLPLRVQFCEWLLQQHEANPNFVKSILFTDECFFSRNGTFNIHNYHVWADENPHAIHVNAFQHRFSINLWARILGDSRRPSKLNKTSTLLYSNWWKSF